MIRDNPDDRIFRDYAFNPNSVVAAANALGGTGHWPVPSGDPPLGTGKTIELFRAPVFSASVRSLPSGQWPDGTGGSPVPPVPISEFGFNVSYPRPAHAGRGRRCPVIAHSYVMCIVPEISPSGLENGPGDGLANCSFSFTLGMCPIVRFFAHRSAPAANWLRFII